MCTCSLNFPLELEQDWLLNCLPDATPWIPNRYRQLNMFKTELSVFPLKPSPTLCTASVMASTLPVVLAKPWDCPWFLSSHIPHPRCHKSLWAPPSKLVQKPTFPYLHFDHPGPRHHLFLNYMLIYYKYYVICPEYIGTPNRPPSFPLAPSCSVLTRWSYENTS